MKPCKYLVVVLFALAGCESAMVYYNPSVSEARMRNDTLDCEVVALKEAPVAMKTDTSPGYWVPEKDDREGYYVPGSTYSFDVNKNLREDLTNRCMTSKGYQEIGLPVCTEVGPATISSAGAGRMPPLTENSCVVRDGKSGWKIINPPG